MGFFGSLGKAVKAPIAKIGNSSPFKQIKKAPGMETLAKGIGPSFLSSSAPTQNQEQKKKKFSQPTSQPSVKARNATERMEA